MNLKGARAEQAAAAFLQSHGLELLEANYRCRFGEIDLILRDQDTLVFAEVRMRSGKEFGGAAESITAAKQEKLRRTAQHYLGRLRQVPYCRFDALLIDTHGIEWIKNAFDG